MVKKFLLDTNILLENPHSMVDGFADNHVILCGTTLQELDKKKTVGGETGYNARECCRILDELRMQGDLLKGIKLPNGGKLSIEPDGVKSEYLPEGFSLEVPDNRIISSCIHIMRNSKRTPVILVTNDISMRINATICGVKVEGYKNSIIKTSGYTGHIDLDVPTEYINSLYADKSLILPEDISDTLLANEFVTLHAGKQSALSVFRNGKLNLIKEQTLFGGIKPKNAMQKYAMWALTAPAEEIPLVILLGPAGCAKTFLSLAAGLDGTYQTQRRSDSEYIKLLISRPTAQSFEDIGYLPGDLNDKLFNLYQSFYDNIEVLLSGNSRDMEDHQQVQTQMQDMFDDGVIEVCGLNFIRGRSLMNTYMICDEAQNASRTMIRDVITRAGIGTKLVIAGDPSQIDVPTLDKRNNGLVYAAEHMKGSPLCAIIQFDSGSSVRSPLAKEAIQCMKG